MWLMPCSRSWPKVIFCWRCIGQWSPIGRVGARRPIMRQDAAELRQQRQHGIGIEANFCAHPGEITPNAEHVDSRGESALADLTSG
jgi:hypothetical protein